MVMSGMISEAKTPCSKFDQGLLPELSDFFLDLHQFLADQGFAKSLDRSTGMPTFFANPPPSRSRHISSGKIARFRYYIQFTVVA